MGVHKNYQTGNYYIRIKYYGQEFEKVIGRDRRAAELALAEVKLDIKLSKLSGQGWEGFQKLRKAKRPKTFAELAKDYIEERANYKTSSLSSYKSILNHHLLPEFGRLPLKSITDSQLKSTKYDCQMRSVHQELIRLCSSCEASSIRRTDKETSIEIHRRLCGECKNQKWLFNHYQKRS